MNISELGEFGLIDRLAKKIRARNASTVKGVGDDAAVVAPCGKCSLLTTDMLLEGIHFDLTYVPMKHLGYKAATVGFSDIYAMNGFPKQMVASLGVSNRFSVEHIEELYEGMLLACERHGVDMVGGDTSASLTGLTVGVSALGECEPDRVVYRSGAKPTDLICITGSLGSAYMGLLLLEREKKVLEANPRATPQLAGYEHIIEQYLKPEANRDLILNLREADVTPTAMIDISDGLASDMLQICRQSGVGAHLYLDKIPIAKQCMDMAEEMNFDAVTAALNGGEDYELLFTIPLSLYEKVKDLGRVAVIGHVVEADKGALLIPPNGEPVRLQAQGFRGIA
ncbi:MAG: thiamine-phosphate kinase [Prevotellaceae bacterium]|jgi:thiamine-monophosphate kinase|nr:thiamine-phosphate kinase [Prevotellaceae bacterium]